MGEIFATPTTYGAFGWDWPWKSVVIAKWQIHLIQWKNVCLTYPWGYCPGKLKDPNGKGCKSRRREKNWAKNVQLININLGLNAPFPNNSLFHWQWIQCFFYNIIHNPGWIGYAEEPIKTERESLAIILYLCSDFRNNSGIGRHEEATIAETLIDWLNHFCPGI
jgi:hypothetical protein